MFKFLKKPVKYVTAGSVYCTFAGTLTGCSVVERVAVPVGRTAERHTGRKLQLMPDCRRQVEEYYYDHLPGGASRSIP